MTELSYKINRHTVFETSWK